MNKVTVSYGQTWLDIAMQELGDIERTMELVQLNNRALSNELEAGEVLLVPDFDSKKRSIIQDSLPSHFYTLFCPNSVK